MLDGNMFLPVTGMPIRNSAFINSPLALAEPVPLTVAILMTKSLVRVLPIVILFPLAVEGFPQIAQIYTGTKTKALNLDGSLFQSEGLHCPRFALLSICVDLCNLWTAFESRPDFCDFLGSR